MEEIIETPHSKGFEFEKKFERFMKTDLSWDKTVIRPQMPSAINMKGTNVDIVASRKDRRGEDLVRYGKFCLGIAGLGIILTFLNADSQYAYAILIFSFICIGVGALSFYLSNSRHMQNAWVECKNTKKKTDFDQVNKVVTAVNAYKNSGYNKYNFVEVYFVSASGFVEPALNFAEENGIKCYIVEDGKFVRKTYWEE